MSGNFLNIKINNAVVFTLSVAFLFSQFYLWKSGLPQISHILIVICILLGYKEKILIDRSIFLFIFLSYSILVNLFWTLVNYDLDYIVSIIYWIFNFILFLLIINFSFEQTNKLFSNLVILIPFSYVLIIFMWSIGLGSHSFFPRYNGFFNDPNQMAFWVLSTCCIFLLISNNFFKNFVVYSMSVFLILLTMSRSALLGVFFITLALLIKQRGDLNRKLMFFILASFFVFVIIFYLYFIGVFDELILRMIEGLSASEEQAEGRGFDIILKYPEYLFFGAGQGAYSLYHSAGLEIHSTWLGILFYYGIIGLGIFLIFLFNIFKDLELSNKLLFLAPMIYGFTTYNARTTIFWFLLSIFILFLKYRRYIFLK